MISAPRSLGSRPCGSRHFMQHLQQDDLPVHQHFTRMLEIDRYPAVNDRLHLTDPPIRTLWVTDELPRFEKKSERRHATVTPLGSWRLPMAIREVTQP
jgi:hypothetical protein